MDQKLTLVLVGDIQLLEPLLPTRKLCPLNTEVDLPSFPRAQRHPRVQLNPQPRLMCLPGRWRHAIEVLEHEGIPVEQVRLRYKRWQTLCKSTVPISIKAELVVLMIETVVGSTLQFLRPNLELVQQYALTCSRLTVGVVQRQLAKQIVDPSGNRATFLRNTEWSKLSAIGAVQPVCCRVKA